MHITNCKRRKYLSRDSDGISWKVSFSFYVYKTFLNSQISKSTFYYKYKINEDGIESRKKIKETMNLIHGCPNF